MRASPDLRMGIELILLPRKFYSCSRAGPVLEIPASRSPGVVLNTFENQRNSLADADAHGAERISALGSQEMVERRGHKTRAAGAQGVPESNRATVWVHMRRVVRDSQFAQRGQRLRSECFVQFHDVHLSERQTCFGEK